MRAPAGAPASAALAAIAALLAAAGAGVAATGSGAGDVAAPAISAAAVPEGGVVLPTVASPPAVAKISVRVTDATGVDRVVLGLFDRAGRHPDGRTVTAARTSGTAKNGTWTASLTLPRDSSVGWWYVRGFATDLAGNMSEPDTTYGSLLVRHAVRVTGFDMGPASVAAGTPMSAAGVLQRYKPGVGWVPYGGKKIHLEFCAPGCTAWVPVAARTTDAAGRFGTPTVRARTSGSWRLAWAGNVERAPAVSKADAVEVALPAPGPAPTPSDP